MTTDGLRVELDRIAAEAPVVSVPPGTWGRARRARMRDRVVGALGAAAAVALVAGLAVLPRHAEPPVAGGDRLGVPDRLYAVPYRMAARADDDSWARDEVSDDLAIGRGAVAWVMDQGLPVVVDADDGDYHLLDLPDFVGNDGLNVTGSSEIGLSLSPDGRRLAYAYGDPGPEDDDSPVPSGVRVVDLETGAVAETPVAGGEGTLVERIAWSGDGRWLAWTGSRLAAWTEGTLGEQTPVSGRIAPGASSSEPVVGRWSVSADDISIDDDGVVTTSAAGRGTIERWDGRPTDRVSLPRGGGLELASRPGGSLVAVGGFGSDVLSLLDPATGRARELPGTPAADPLGWVGGRVLALSGVVTDGDRLLLLAGADGTQKVATVSTGVRFLSVAVDLVRPDRLGVERPEPQWPWSYRTWLIVIGLGTALAVAALAALRWYGRRWWAARRRQPRSAR